MFMRPFYRKDFVICCYKKAEQRYLNLEELGNVLKILSSSQTGTYICIIFMWKGFHLSHYQSPSKNLLAVLQHPRTFHSKLLKAGSPNLLVVPPGENELLWWFVVWVMNCISTVAVRLLLYRNKCEYWGCM